MAGMAGEAAAAAAAVACPSQLDKGLHQLNLAARRGIASTSQGIPQGSLRHAPVDARLD